MALKPLFKELDKVLHVSKDKVGTVRASFQDGTGTRYYVDHSGFRWSVPESALELEKVQIRAQSNQVVSGTKISKLPVA